MSGKRQLLQLFSRCRTDLPHPILSTEAVLGILDKPDCGMDTETKHSILVLDDEEVIRDFLSEILEGYNVTLACDGDEAIDRLKQQQFDLVITDLRMPRVPGEEVVKTAHKINPDAKVIVISGYSSLYTASQSVSSGVSAYLAKPFSIKELIQAVTTALEG